MDRQQMEEHVRAALREAADLRDPSRPEGLSLRGLEISDVLMTDIMQFAQNYGRGTDANVVPMEKALPEESFIIAPGAFDSQIGKEVPLRMGIGGPVIGQARIEGTEGGALSMSFRYSNRESQVSNEPPDDPDHEMPSLQPHEGLAGEPFSIAQEEVTEDAATEPEEQHGETEPPAVAWTQSFTGQ